MLFPNHLSSPAAGNDLEMCMSSLVPAQNVLEILTLYRTLLTYKKRVFFLLFVFFSISAKQFEIAFITSHAHKPVQMLMRILESYRRCSCTITRESAISRKWSLSIHENLSWAAKRYFNQLYDVFTSKTNQFFIANSGYASFSKTRQPVQLAGLTIRL